MEPTTNDKKVVGVFVPFSCMPLQIQRAIQKLHFAFYRETLSRFQVRHFTYPS
jgi:hypothetical protein